MPGTVLSAGCRGRLTRLSSHFCRQVSEQLECPNPGRRGQRHPSICFIIHWGLEKNRYFAARRQWILRSQLNHSRAPGLGFARSQAGKAPPPGGVGAGVARRVARPPRCRESGPTPSATRAARSAGGAVGEGLRGRPRRGAPGLGARPPPLRAGAPMAFLRWRCAQRLSPAAEDTPMNPSATFFAGRQVSGRRGPAVPGASGRQASGHDVHPGRTRGAFKARFPPKLKTARGSSRRNGASRRSPDLRGPWRSAQAQGRVRGPGARLTMTAGARGEGAASGGRRSHNSVSAKSLESELARSVHVSVYTVRWTFFVHWDYCRFSDAGLYMLFARAPLCCVPKPLGAQ